MDGVQLLQGCSHFEEAVRYILEISIVVFESLLAKLNMQNMYYEILPSVKLQGKTTT